MDHLNQKYDNSIYNNIPETEENESYVDQYQEEQEEENNILEENEDNLDTRFSEALDRDTFENEDLEDDDLDEDLDESDLDDDLIEDYDENDREVDSYATDKLKEENSDLVFDIDKDLEEVDPVNHPREFDY